MALFAKHKDVRFGVGDIVRVSQLIQDDEKSRTQVFEGMVLGIRGSGNGKSFVVRRIGAQQIGIEKIFPINAPIVQAVQVVKTGARGIRRSKLYYTRDKSRREITKIYSRNTRREDAKTVSAKPTAKDVHASLVKKSKTTKTKKTSSQKNAPKKTAKK